MCVSVCALLSVFQGGRFPVRYLPLQGHAGVQAWRESGDRPGRRPLDSEEIDLASGSTLRDGPGRVRVNRSAVCNERRPAALAIVTMLLHVYVYTGQPGRGCQPHACTGDELDATCD